MGDITPHFSRREFGLSAAAASAYGFEETPYPEEWVEPRLRPLCLVLERLRDTFGGRRVKVICGYRPREYDLARIAKLGPGSGISPDSQHHDGLAVDFQILGPDGEPMDPQVVADKLARLYAVSAIEIGGLGVYPGHRFVHVDRRPMRPGEALHRWRFPAGG